MNRDGPWAEVDAHRVRVGLNAREPEGSGLPLSGYAAAIWRLLEAAPLTTLFEVVFASGSGTVGLAPGLRSTQPVLEAEGSEMVSLHRRNRKKAKAHDEREPKRYERCGSNRRKDRRNHALGPTESSFRRM